MYTVPLLALLVACGGKPAAQQPKASEPAPSADLDPRCPAAGPITLPADGRLRCRELPLQVTFPPGTKLVRTDDNNTALFNADLPNGVMGLVVEPRTDRPDAARVTELLAKLVEGIAGDAETAPVEAPPLPGATASAALAFTTPDGGAGLVRGYFVHHWLVAIVVGGRKPESPARPESAVAASFLDSLRLRPPATGTVEHALAEGAKVAIPATAWSGSTLPPEPGVRAEWLMLVPERGYWIGVRELAPDPDDRCEFLRAAGDDLADRMKKIYGGTELALQHIAKASFGDVAVYADAEAGPRRIALYLICAGRSVVQLSVVGDKPLAEMRPQLDALAKSLVGAPK